MPDPLTIASVASTGLSIIGGFADRNRQKRVQQKQLELAINADRRAQQQFDRDIDREAYFFDKLSGPAVENLRRYYAKQTPDSLKRRGLQENAKRFEEASESVRQNLAQRGIQYDSGIALAADLYLDTSRAQSDADILANAENLAAQIQGQALQLGQSNATPYAGSNAAAIGASTSANAATILGNQPNPSEGLVEGLRDATNTIKENPDIFDFGGKGSNKRTSDRVGKLPDYNPNIV